MWESYGVVRDVRMRRRWISLFVKVMWWCRRGMQIVFVITLTDSLSSEDRDRDNKTLYKTEKVKAIKKKLYVIALADDLRYPSPCFAIRT